MADTLLTLTTWQVVALVLEVALCLGLLWFVLRFLPTPEGEMEAREDDLERMT